MSRMRTGVVGLARFLAVLGAIGALLLLGAVIFNGTASAHSTSLSSPMEGKHR